MTKATTLESQHRDYIKWTRELNFFNDELKLFENQLEQLIGRSEKSSLPRFEHFQNSFLRQHEVIDELLHDIKIIDRELISVRDGRQIKLVDKVQDYDTLRVRMETFVELYAELKSEFVEFVNSMIAKGSS
ncbi:MAG: hypothetical protein HKN76_01225 [Saprospiraceae bacterium]|nr:hypothetical protein [Saprospiraceae bacterium]